jgi:hypothetical protein
MGPIVHGLENDYYGEIKFVYLDVDDPENDQLKRTLGYRVQPHFFLLDPDGNVIQQWFGRVSRDDFALAFDSALQQ